MTTGNAHSSPTEVAIVGGGLAGLVTAYELLGKKKKVTLIDRDTPKKLGGLAKLSFGGVCLVGTPYQKRLGIEDTPDLAWKDWQRVAQFDPDPNEAMSQQWAKYYCDNSLDGIYSFLDGHGIKFLPLVNWPERGVHSPGNSVPRWHIAWGTGYEIVNRLLAALERHPHRQNLQLRFSHKVDDIVMQNGRAVGVHGQSLQTNESFEIRAEQVVLASGGICGGDLSMLRENWYKPWGAPPQKLLRGAHRFGDGLLHERARQHGAQLTNLDKQWHYAAGIHKPNAEQPDEGISLVPPRSALWMDARGRRFGPEPLVSYGDTRHLVEKICRSPGQYSWHVMNRKIALKELAVSGCDYMTAFRQKNKLKMVRDVLFGNKELVDRLGHDCPDDFITANSLDELSKKMQEKSLFGMQIDTEGLKADVREYDEQIGRGKSFYSDDQLRRLLNFRTYRGDRIRLCNFQKIDDPKARPLIAIRQFILVRKSLGGIKTDLNSRVVDRAQNPIEGLYAVGEAAGFGGGGIHGTGSLEGTFLGGCVLTARVAARSI